MITSKEKNICPNCGGNLIIRDSKKRIVKNISGEEFIFSLRRLRCEKCHKLHEEIPDLIKPYKQYSKNAIEIAISGKCDFYAMEDITVYRWKKENTPSL